MVALIGGLGLGSLAAARRTQSSFSVLLAATNPSDFDVSIYSGGTVAPTSATSALTRKIARLPGVRHVAAGFVVTGAPLTPDGSPRIRVTGLAYPVASVNGLFFTQDRMVVNEGRLASPQRADEIVMAPVIARLLGFHVGQVVPFGFYSNAQQSLPGFGTKAVPPALRMNMKIVGLASLSSEIVEDDVDILPTFIPLTPAFAREAVAHGDFSTAVTFGIKTSGGAATVPLVEREIAGLAPPGDQVTDHALTPVVAKADRALKPISIALGVFGAVALLAAVLVATQLMARRLRVDREDLRILRALGADPADIILDGLIGLEAALALGSILAAVIAVALSPLSPLGPVAPVYPDRGLSWDWTVLGFGVLALITVLGGIGRSAGVRGCAAPDRAPTPTPPDVRGTRGGVRSACRAVGPRGGRGPDGARARRGPGRRAGALGAPRVGVGGGPRRHDVDVRRQPPHAGLEPAALRVELDVHPQSGRVRRRGGAPGRARDAQARQGRRRLFRSVLQRPAGGRPGGPVPPRERRGTRHAAHPHRTRVPGG